MKNIVDIMADWLREHGYDGLFSPNGECACKNDDLGPCDSWPHDCEPGYLAPCPETCGEHGWHIQREKPKDMP